jgi:hypothetical protein
MYIWAYIIHAENAVDRNTSIQIFKGLQCPYHGVEIGSVRVQSDGEDISWSMTIIAIETSRNHIHTDQGPV